MGGGEPWTLTPKVRRLDSLNQGKKLSLRANRPRGHVFRVNFFSFLHSVMGMQSLQMISSPFLIFKFSMSVFSPIGNEKEIQFSENIYNVEGICRRIPPRTPALLFLQEKLYVYTFVFCPR